MADNIMPYTYFSTVLPRLATELPGLKIFYEQKANLPRERLVLLRRCGHPLDPAGDRSAVDRSAAAHAQGHDGTAEHRTAARCRRGLQITLMWNLLWGFPGDRPASYEETLAMLPLLHHLQPPSGFVAARASTASVHTSTRPSSFGIRNLRPYPGLSRFSARLAPRREGGLPFHRRLPMRRRRRAAN